MSSMRSEATVEYGASSMSRLAREGFPVVPVSRAAQRVCQGPRVALMHSQCTAAAAHALPPLRCHHRTRPTVSRLEFPQPSRGRLSDACDTHWSPLAMYVRPAGGKGSRRVPHCGAGALDSLTAASGAIVQTKGLVRSCKPCAAAHGGHLSANGCCASSVRQPEHVAIKAQPQAVAQVVTAAVEAPVSTPRAGALRTHSLPHAFMARESSSAAA